MKGQFPIPALDLKAPTGFTPTSERLVRQAGINVDPGHIPQTRSDFIISVANLMTGEVWYIPSDVAFLTRLANNIDKLITDAATVPGKVQ